MIYDYSLSDKYFDWSRPALAWFCQTKVWTPFSESLYLTNKTVHESMRYKMIF